MQTHEGLLAGRYELGPVIGRGGMSEVYEATDRRLRREVAVKRLRSDIAEEPAMQRRLEAEARSAALLSHPNIVAVFDTGWDESGPFIVMERIHGHTLADEAGAGALEPDRVLRVGEEVLSALAAAHERAIVHRDIKPGNVLVTESGACKVVDFGIAKSLGTDATLTATGEMVGSPAYIAPECLSGEPPTVRSDLYAVGMLLYECLAGRKPFEVDGLWPVLLAAQEGRMVPLASLDTGADPAFVAAIDRSLAVDPEQRFSSADEMAAALRGLDDPSVETAVIPIAANDDDTAVLPPRDDRRTQVIPVLGSPSAAAASPAASAPMMTPSAPPKRRLPLAATAFIVVGLLIAAAIVFVIVAGLGDNGGGPAKPRATPSVVVPAPVQHALDRLTRVVRG
jgi:eukaryotic-like serine/threonine-protein kinase